LIASGTTADLQHKANVTDTDLERVFINLTTNVN
jgi:hypothetical protein